MSDDTLKVSFLGCREVSAGVYVYAAYISSLSCGRDRIPDQNNLKGKGLFGSLVESRVHHVGKAWQ